MATRSEILEFGFAMGKHAPKATQWHLERLLRCGATYNRWATEHCNRQLTDSEQQRWLRIANKIGQLCSEMECKPKLQNDPRGVTVKIVVPDGYTNDWGKEGICVPTS